MEQASNPYATGVCGTMSCNHEWETYSSKCAYCGTEAEEIYRDLSHRITELELQIKIDKHQFEQVVKANVIWAGREHDWNDLELLHRRQAAMYKIQTTRMQIKINGQEEVSQAELDRRKDSIKKLNEHIFRFQTKLGCAPSIVRTCGETDA